MDKDTSKAPTNVATREILAQQWETACRVYAWHEVSSMQSGVQRAKAVEHLNNESARFRALGGVAKVGKDVLGANGPSLELSDGNAIPYRAGMALVADFAQSLLA